MSSEAQNTVKPIAILDLTERNAESNEARLISSKHLMDVVGIPYVITTNIAEASKCNMIFCTSLLSNTTLSAEERILLEEFVFLGGSLVAPRVEGDKLFELFGIDGFESSKSRYEMIWDTSFHSPSLAMINEPEEVVISLGNSSIDEIFKTLGYNVQDAHTMAHFEDGTSAVIKNAFGSGYAIGIGLSWKDVILRNQINRDFEAQRISSNGFEPTTDVFMLFLRGLYMEHNPYTVWKNTSPGNSRSSLMITHDVDSNSGMDSLKYFVEYEQENQIEGTFNITLKYFTDALSSDFYTDRQEELEFILSNGHQVQSHSVGHFFDFADENIIPIGVPGNTKENYSPYNDGVVTTGATVYGECEVSKAELENDLDIKVRTFRSGHLAYPKDLVEVLDKLDYEYNSSFTACDVLTNFPYQNVFGLSFNQALSNIYEIPVTISDVFSDDPISELNILDKATVWIKTTLKNTDNGAPTVLLIHPNRRYKLEGLKHFLSGLEGESVHTMEIGKFGDFWKARKDFAFSTAIVDNHMVVTVEEEQGAGGNVSLVVKNGQDLTNIVVQNELNQVLSFKQAAWGENDQILYLEDAVTNIASIPSESINVKAFPNPAVDYFVIEFHAASSSIVNLSLFDLNGNRVLVKNDYVSRLGTNRLTVDSKGNGLATGTYFLVLENKSGLITSTKLVLM